MNSIHPKVVAGAIGSATAILISYCLALFANVTLPPEVAAALATVLTFAFGYLTPSPTAAPPQNGSSLK